VAGGWAQAGALRCFVNGGLARGVPAGHACLPAPVGRRRAGCASGAGRRGAPVCGRRVTSHNRVGAIKPIILRALWNAFLALWLAIASPMRS